MARLDPGETFENLKIRVKEEIKANFPQEGDKNILEVKDVSVKDEASSDNVTDQKQSKLRGRTWGVPVHATMVLRDKKTGKVIDERTQKIATLPKETNRYSWIVDGSEFQIDNQWRLKPGVYTKVKQNGELQSFFNVKGTPMHVDFDPKTRVFKARREGANPPLYPIMKALGMSDDALEKKWGKDILNANKLDKRGRPVNVDRIAISFASKLAPPGTEVKDMITATQVIKDSFGEMELDPKVTKRTLGKPITKVDSDAVLRASGRLLGVARGDEEPDTRDSLMFKDFMSVEDFIGERLQGSSKVISRRIKNNLDRRTKIRDVVGPDIFQRPIKEFFSKVSLASTPSQTNPLTMISGQMRTTIAGEGGVKDANRITEDAKLVDPSHFGVLDPLHTPESSKTGVNLQLSLGARKTGAEVKLPLINAKTGKVEFVTPEKVYDSVVALPDGVKRVGKKFVAKTGESVKASVPGNELQDVKMKDVQYVVPRSSQMFSIATNMVPFISSDSPNRATMAGRHMEQAIPLVNAEEPLVQSMLGAKSFDELVGQVSSHRASVDGKVTSVGKDSIIIQGTDKKKHRVPIYNNYPLNDKKGFIDSSPVVKAGDTVKKGQLVADTNFTRNGVYAPGTNMEVGYMPWKGYNFEDGVVISDSASKKLTSEHMYKKGLSTREAQLAGKKKFQSYYPDRVNKEQLDKLDDDGVVRVGQKVKPGDTLVTALAERKLTTEEQKMRLLHKSLVQPFKDKSVAWEEDYEGEVVEVVKQGKRVDVHVKTKEPMQVGDKLCFDEKTEVLTSEGWKPVADVSMEDRICCLDHGEIVYDRPTAVYAYPRGDKMYRIRSQQVDLFVTLEHNMYVQQRGRSEFELLPAREIIGKRVRYSKGGMWRGEDVPTFQFPALEVVAGQSGVGRRMIDPLDMDMDHFLALLGAFLADGNCVDIPKSGTYGIEFAAVKEKKREDLRSFLDGAGIHWTNAGGGSKTRVHSKQLLAYFRQFGKAPDKFIPSWVFDLPKARLLVLFHWLFIWGDGCSKAGRPVAQSSVSKKLVDGVQRLALHIGMAANVTVAQEVGKCTIKGREYATRKLYEARIVTAKLRPQVNHGHTDTQSAQTEAVVDNYDKPVYCLTVPSHVLYVRRNGKSVWSGNCGRHGNKSICTQILPDEEMPGTKDGKKLEVLMNPIGTPGRMNIGQVCETAAGKIAEKKGKPFKITNFEVDDNLTHVENELKKEGLSDREDVVDPATGKVIPNIQVGKQYILKLEHQVGKKMAARDRDSYDRNLVPKGGGPHGAQALGSLGMYAMLAHGAKANIRNFQTYQSDKAQGGDNDDLWAALQAGEMLPPPKVTFAYKKLEAYLKGMGVNTEKDGNSLNLVPLTDKQVLEMSNGELKDPGRVIKMRTLQPEKGGLLDPKITGGHDGTNWSHIKLKQPMPNPLFEKAIMSLSGVRGPQYDRIINGEDGVTADGKVVPGKGVKGATYGPSAVGNLLQQVDVKKKLTEEEARIPNLKGQLQNESRRRIKFLRALNKLDMKPTEAYMMRNVPVLPPNMRPIAALEDGSIQTDDLNEIYKNLGIVNKKLGEVPAGAPSSVSSPVAADVYDHLKSLTGLGGNLNRKHPGFINIIAGREGPKTGYAQDVLIKRKMDMTARSTIVPEPSLSLDEAEIPRKAAKEMYKPFITRELRRSAGMTPLAAKKAIEQDDPLAQKALERVVKERPVLLKRDPVLHKYGIQAFKPRLVDGQAIKIHPLVCSGYNADFDGDTMSATIPITEDAVKEARDMFPSRNLFSPATSQVMYTPSHEAQVGLFMMAEVNKKTNLSFKDRDALRKAVKEGKLGFNDMAAVGGVKTTLGRMKLNETMPKQLQGGPLLKDPKYRFTKSEQAKMFNQMARADPKLYPKVSNRLKDLGNKAVSLGGFSFGIEDFKVHRDVRDPILRSAAQKAAKLNLKKPEDVDKFVDTYEAAMNKIDAKLKDKINDPKQRSMLAKLEVAAGIKGRGYRQLTAAPVLFVDGKGEVVTSPVEKSYSEGLDTSSYWAATSGGRKGAIQKVQSVSEPGYMTKLMMNSTMDQLVAADDCKTERGISLSTDEPDIIGRYTTADIKLQKGSIPTGTMLTPDLLTKIKNSKVSKAVVRSPMRCNHAKGVCARCAGLGEDGQLYDKGTNLGVLAAQSLGERGTQLAMRSFHSGGVYGGRKASEKAIEAGGLDRAVTILKMKKKVKGSATLAQAGGKVTAITKDPAGGFNVSIGGTRNYVPANRKMKSRVKIGSVVKKGDPLTHGPINPHDMLPLTGMSKVQGHLAGELHSIYGQHGIRRRHSEMMVRALSGVTKVEDRGDHPDLLPGDFASTSQVYDWNKKAKGRRPVKHRPVLRGVNQIPIDVQTDWMARLNHEHLKDTLIDAAQQGWQSNLHGQHPIPPLIRGAEFGRGTEDAPWAY